MNFGVNHFGVTQYPDNDARRLFVLLSAIDLLERPTASAIADLTGLDRETIDDDIAKLREQYGVMLIKVGDVYRIESWGEVLKKSGVKKFLKP
jgi:predicted DNA-binding transcriptional regulator YafY